MRLDTEAQERVDEAIAEMRARSIALHPERYAPNGEALIAYAGQDWFERTNAWRVAHGLAAIERVARMHPLPDPPKNTYSDERVELPL